MLELFKAAWILIIIVYKLKKKCSESESNDIVSLCHYCYICGLDCFYFIFRMIFIITVIAIVFGVNGPQRDSSPNIQWCE